MLDWMVCDISAPLGSRSPHHGLHKAGRLLLHANHHASCACNAPSLLWSARDNTNKDTYAPGPTSTEMSPTISPRSTLGSFRALQCPSHNDSLITTKFSRPSLIPVTTPTSSPCSSTGGITESLSHLNCPKSTVLWKEVDAYRTRQDLQTQLAPLMGHYKHQLY